MERKTPRKPTPTVVKIIIVVPIISLIAAMAILNCVDVYKIEQKNICNSNLRRFEVAKTNFIVGLICPAGGVYSFGPDDAKPVCSYHGHATRQNTP
jgi:hypothetical protein